MNKTGSDTAKYYGEAVAAYMIWGFFSLVLMPIHNHSSADILFCEAAWKGLTGIDSASSKSRNA